MMILSSTPIPTLLAQAVVGDTPTTAAEGVAEASGGWFSDVLRSLDKIRVDAIEFLPKFLTAIILFLIGVAISTLISRVIRTAMLKGGVDTLCERMGITTMLQRASIKAPLSSIVGKALFWILILMFLTSAAESIGLPQISAPLRGLVNFLPDVITALIITMVGMVVGDLVRGMVATGGDRVGLDYARALGNLVYAFIMIVVLTIAVGTLGVDTVLIRHAVEILLLAGALAVALALGLGMRPLAQNIVSGVYVRDLYPAGSEVKLPEREAGKVVSVGPVNTRLETPSGQMFVPNSTLVSEVVEAKPAPESGK